jgi:uncharacterized membrane protein YdjX (TVP38/TMEM64 family)
MPENPNKPASASEPSLTDMFQSARTLLRRLGPGGPLALISATLPAIGLVTLAFCFNLVGPWLKDQAGLGLLIYVVGFALCAGLAIFPTHIQAALGGWAFGVAVGLPAAYAGVLGAALLGYVIGIRATGDRAVRIIAEKPKWQAVYDGLVGTGFAKSFLIVLLVRLAVSPFALTNLVLAAARVNPVAYALGTLLGLAPRTGAAVVLAAGLKEVTAEPPHKRWLWIASVVVTLVVVAIIGHIANRAINRVTADRRAEPPPAV